jgi:hypothetical protein
MPNMTLTHLEASLLFAALASVAMGITTKKTDHERLRYGLYCFACFLGTLFGLGWLMYFGHR